MTLHGAWTAALEELERAARRAERIRDARVVAHAAYLRGEVQRVRAS